ncbi:helix-turn-helix domain-containing protein [Shewanella kaireitica]|uniref:helix-turn-helix domain-containing protein n=1 Tax=Shewanella kaireitica TaxID=212021 RepID=UPI003D161E2B
MRLKLLAVLHFQDGKSRYQIASYLKVSRTSVNRWISNYLSNGLHGLEEKKHTGRPSALSTAQRSKLTNFIDSSNKNPHSVKLKGPEIQKYISSEFGIEYEISSIYKILERLGYNNH